jgi:glycosyltransferase A (GT-A) superfamily protein (DUF2064 family)
MTVGIAIFVKTPGLSAVKTRLAAGLGEAEAVLWYLEAAAAVTGVVQSVAAAADAVAYYAVAEDAPAARNRWQRLPCILQGDGGLGERMSRVHAELVRRHGAGLLLGADLPQLDPDHVRAACDWLDDPAPRIAWGPSADGGFWLFGANRPADVARWTAVDYGRADTGGRFREVMHDLGAWRTWPVRHDVDQLRDLAPALRELRALKSPTGDQRRLAASMAWRILGALGGHD